MYRGHQMSRRIAYSFTSSCPPSSSSHPYLKRLTPNLRRYASSTPSLPRRFLSTTLFIATGTLFIAYYYDSRSIIHEHVAMPLIRFTMDPETGHRLATRLLSLDRWARPRDRGVDGKQLGTEVSILSASMQKVQS